MHLHLTYIYIYLLANSHINMDNHHFDLSWSNQLFHLFLWPCSIEGIYPISTWAFPEIGVPLNHPFLDGMFHLDKLSSYWGILISGQPHMFTIIGSIRVYIPMIGLSLWDG